MSSSALPGQVIALKFSTGHKQKRWLQIKANTREFTKRYKLDTMRNLFNLITSAVKRCRIYVLTIFITYCISCFNGNSFALAYYMNLSADGTCNLYVTKQDEDAKNKELGTLLVSSKISNFTSNQWHTLTLRFLDSTITGFVDKEQALTATDTTFSEGMAGLVSRSQDKNNNSALFDNLLINEPNGVLPTPVVFSEKVKPLYKKDIT